MEGVQVGRICHFVSEQDHLAAMVVKVIHAESGLVNLHVFAAGDELDIKDTYIVQKVKYSTRNEVYTWHWPERT